MDSRFPAVWQRVTGEMQPAHEPLRHLTFLKYSAHCRYHKLAAAPCCFRLSGFFSKLAREELYHFQQLKAAYFLINGERLSFSAPPELHVSTLLTALRESYRLETELSQAFLSCPSDTSAADLRSISETDSAHALQIARQVSRLL